MTRVQTSVQWQTFSDVLRSHASSQKFSSKIYLYDVHHAEGYSFAEINTLVDQTVTFLKTKGCNKGDIVSAVLGNRLEYFLLFFACQRVGATFNPFPISLSAVDICKYMDYISPKLLFCEKKHASSLGHLPMEVMSVDNIEGDQTFLEIIKALPADTEVVSVDINSPACLYYSSGTTGNPKGILYSHKNMTTLISSLVRGFSFSADDRHMIVLPLGHTASINYSFLPATWCAGTLFLCDSFWKARPVFWKLIEQHRITYIEVVPSILFSLLNTPYKDYDRKKVASLEYIGCGSAPLPLDVQFKMEQKFSIRVANLYGLSETGPTHFDDPRAEGWTPGSVGYPLDVNEVKIFDKEGCGVPDGEVGEIGVKGDNVFTGYYQNEKAYQDVMRDGYFLTGDLGFRKSDGRYYFAEREKDLIIKGGVNIFPGEIDEILFAHPSVKESSTVGCEHPYLGEIIKSFVVLKEGELTDSETIRRYCLDRLGEFKSPDEVIFVEDIPKGPSGKLLRRKLKELV